MKSELLLIRHGETVWNTLNKFQGAQDSPLSPRGEEQARALAERFKSESVDAFYSSPLGRARATAEAAARAAGVELQFDERLREKSYGIFEGLSMDEIEVQHPEAYAGYHSGDMSYEIPGGESGEEAFARILACLEEIGDRHAGQRVAILTHGGVVIAVMRLLLKMDYDIARAFALRNTALNTLIREAGTWSAGPLGDNAHTRDIE